MYQGVVNNSCSLLCSFVFTATTRSLCNPRAGRADTIFSIWDEVVVVVAIVIATTPFFTRSSKWMVYYLVSSSWLLIKLVFRLAPATTADDWGSSRRRHLVNLAEAFGRKIVNLFKLRISHTNSTTAVLFGSTTTNTTAPAPYVPSTVHTSTMVDDGGSSRKRQTGKWFLYIYQFLRFIQPTNLLLLRKSTYIQFAQQGCKIWEK